jgi:hypothetical protein
VFQGERSALELLSRFRPRPRISLENWVLGGSRRIYTSEIREPCPPQGGRLSADCCALPARRDLKNRGCLNIHKRSHRACPRSGSNCSRSEGDLERRHTHETYKVMWHVSGAVAIPRPIPEVPPESTDSQRASRAARKRVNRSRQSEPRRRQQIALDRRRSLHVSTSRASQEVGNAYAGNPQANSNRSSRITPNSLPQQQVERKRRQGSPPSPDHYSSRVVRLFDPRSRLARPTPECCWGVWGGGGSGRLLTLPCCRAPRSGSAFGVAPVPP